MGPINAEKLIYVIRWERPTFTKIQWLEQVWRETIELVSQTIIKEIPTKKLQNRVTQIQEIIWKYPTASSTIGTGTPKIKIKLESPLHWSTIQHVQHSPRGNLAKIEAEVFRVIADKWIWRKLEIQNVADRLKKAHSDFFKHDKRRKTPDYKTKRLKELRDDYDKFIELYDLMADELKTPEPAHKIYETK